MNRAAAGGVSVVIPARDEAARIGAVVSAVLAQEVDAPIDVIVVDDGSCDDTAGVAAAAGARVVRLPFSTGSPGAARNRGAAVAKGDPIVFLDADCTPSPGWLNALLRAHATGEEVVGGSIGMAPGSPASARCDHYCSAYHMHEARARRLVPNHSPQNLSVRRDAFLATRGFTEEMPVAYAHEELGWQAELRQAGGRILLEPAAVVFHDYRPGWPALLRRNYRWAYSAIQAKSSSPTVRLPWLYSRPWLLIAAAAPFAVAHTVYTVGCWARAGVLEPVAMLPAVLAARLAYAFGLVRGGSAWLAQRPLPPASPVPRG